MTPSYVENAEAMPLSKKAMELFVSNVFEEQGAGCGPASRPREPDRPYGPAAD